MVWKRIFGNYLLQENYEIPMYSSIIPRLILKHPVKLVWVPTARAAMFLTVVQFLYWIWI